MKNYDGLCARLSESYQWTGANYVQEAVAAIRALEAERDALKPDAERYRWLRFARSASLANLLKLRGWCADGSDHDAALDAARGK